MVHYSIYRPRRNGRLSWPSWLTYSGRLTNISGHPSAASRAWDRESSPVKDWRSTTGQTVFHFCICPPAISNFTSLCRSIKSFCVTRAHTLSRICPAFCHIDDLYGVGRSSFTERTMWLCDDAIDKLTASVVAFVILTIYTTTQNEHRYFEFFCHSSAQHSSAECHCSLCPFVRLSHASV